MSQLMTEGTLMGIIGACAGVILSIIFIPILNRLGITLPPGPGQEEPIPLYLQPEPVTVLVIGIGATAVAGFSSILPALRTVRIRIADALRSF